MKKDEVIALWSVVSRGLRANVKDEILVPTGAKGKFNVRDYVKACCIVGEYTKANPNVDLSDIQSFDEMLRGISGLAVYRWGYYTPCLAVRIDEVPKEKQDECYESLSWDATEKLDGVRAWLEVCGKDVRLYSRFYSQVDCTLVDFWGHVDQEVELSSKGIVADVEITLADGAEDYLEMGDEPMGRSEVLNAFLTGDRENAIAVQRRYKESIGRDMLVFHLIAPIRWNGRDYADALIGDGIKVYREVGECLAELGFNICSLKRCIGSRVEKENFLNCILANGGEGIVFHNRAGLYCTSENRSKNSYIKVKRGAGVKVGLSDTLDAFVTGYKVGSDGLISVLEFSVWMNDCGDVVRKFVGNISGISIAAKRAMTVMDAGGMYPQEFLEDDGSVGWRSLNPKWDGAVAELGGSGMLDNCRLDKPEFIQWRRDKDMQSCVYTKEWMLSQVK